MRAMQATDRKSPASRAKHNATPAAGCKGEVPGVHLGGLLMLRRGRQHLFKRHRALGQLTQFQHAIRRNLVAPLRDGAQRHLEVSRNT